jgi:hypothetical protein
MLVRSVHGQTDGSAETVVISQVSLSSFRKVAYKRAAELEFRGGQNGKEWEEKQRLEQRKKSKRRKLLEK